METYLVSITPPGKITIPIAIRRKLGLLSGGRAIVWKEGKTLVIEPVPSDADKKLARLAKQV